MLDIKFIRENLEKVKRGIQGKGIKVDIDKLLKLDERRREFLKDIDDLKAKQKRTKDRKEAKNIKGQINSHKQALVDIEKEYYELLKNVPNLPAKDVKIGKDESDNKPIGPPKGEPPKFDFKAKDYMELAKMHDLIDTERAAKVSGTRFNYLKREAALLWNALVQYSLEMILKEKFIPFSTPVLVKKEIMEDSGYDSYIEGQEAYYIEKDNLFLVGTGEHVLLPYHRNEILVEKELPLYYTTYSTCFRREAGSYGRDTKGIFRVHQFDKLEMVILTTPDKSWEEFTHLVKIQEKIVKGLKLSYQLLEVCTGDLPKPSAKVIDLECWFPSEKRYRETHSASNCTDYQARRNNIRFRNKNGKTDFVHILNATGITPRTLIAILENYQTKDGKVKVPKVLQNYTGFKEITR